MNNRIANKKLRKAYEAGTLTRRYPEGVARAFEALMELIEAVNDESELYAFKGLRPEVLKGRGNERSMRLNGQFRLIFEIVNSELIVLDIEDYH